jgi:nucleotide-binding universal stress UspA family protein
MKKILIAVETLELNDDLLTAGGQLARDLSAEIVLLHVAPASPDFVGYEPGPISVRESVACRLREEHRRLQEAEQSLRKQGLTCQALMIEGVPAEKIVAETVRIGADLIIVGSHRHGRLHRLIAGSVTADVLRHAPCPVLVVPRPRA